MLTPCAWSSSSSQHCVASSMRSGQHRGGPAPPNLRTSHLQLGAGSCQGKGVYAIACSVQRGTAAALAVDGPSPVADRVALTALAGRGDGEVGAGASCAAYLAGLEDMQQTYFVCPLYSPKRARVLELVFAPTMHALLEQGPALVAAFVGECQRTQAAAAALDEGAAVAPP
jgi:hypothetical protein